MKKKFESFQDLNLHSQVLKADALTTELSVLLISEGNHQLFIKSWPLGPAYSAHTSLK